MAFDGIPRTHCYSLTDFNTFDFCPFRFYVTHRLGKKYEIEEGNENMALGTLLDESIKKFHKAGAYGQPSTYLVNIIRASANDIREKAAKAGDKPSFYSTFIKFVNEDLIKKAEGVFANYYNLRGGKINRSLGEVKFCEWVMEIGGEKYKLWGWPDTYEMGIDGLPEIIDCKSRQGLDFDQDSKDPDHKYRDKVKASIDMTFMPKLYALLASQDLMKMGYTKARFKVRFWQDPLEEGFFEDFDLSVVPANEYLFKQKLEKIIANKSIRFCEKAFCSACNCKDRKEFLLEPERMGFSLEEGGVKVMTGEELLVGKFKYRNAVVSGPIGSGKSTLAKNLAEKLGYKYLSTGEFFRKWHKTNNIPLEQSDKVPEEIDKEIDRDAKKLLNDQSGIVFEAHIAGWLAQDLEDIFKILVQADFKTRMERTAAREGVTIEKAVKLSDERAEAHRKKFKKLYGIEDRFNESYFDLVVDTTKMSEEEVLENVLKKMIEK